ncbi:DNRLRE domain-containing protein, partial [Candidatus Uhrbacteria bacterium]|nr:DNRLRE domain-containing protein [Candidatus Uhrbacteria bacterium]
MTDSHYYTMVWVKKRAFLVFVFLFVFSPILPVFAQRMPPIEKIDEQLPQQIQDENKNNENNKPLLSPQTAPTIPTSSNPENNIVPSTIKQFLPDTDENTGALVYTYPITIPPGRNGMQPDVRLNYHNQQNESASIFGYGWSLSIPFIQRLNKKGSQELFNQDDFTSSLSGELSARTNTTYGAKNDTGEFLEYVPSDISNGTVWTVYDKQGTVYTFGSTSDSRQDNPNNSTQVFKWMISEIRDRNDNFVSFSYEKDTGQIYPKIITYTGNGTTNGIFTVEFVREAREDIGKSYKEGFLVQTKMHVNQIKVKVNNGLVRTYNLDYSAGQAGLRSLLTSIQETGHSEEGDTITRNPTTFTYQTQSTYSVKSIGATFGDELWVSPVYTDTGVIVADVNGDALPDILSSVMNYSVGTQCGKLERDAYLNTGSSWIASATWLPPIEIPFGSKCNGSYDNGIQAVDLNGDGLTDLVRNQSINNVFLNTGSGWKFDSSYSDFSESFIQAQGQIHQGMWLIDINGDGLPDWIKADNGYTTIQLNTGTGWANQISEGAFIFPVQESLSSYFGVAFADVNNDGLVDILRGGGWTVPYIWLNTGSGWILDPSFKPPTGFLESTNGGDGGVRMIDLNNDGLIDFARKTKYDSSAWLNTGSGWTDAPAWKPEGSCIYNFMTKIGDLDADGLIDEFCAVGQDYPPTTYTTLNTGTHNDQLVQILYPTGGSTNISYKDSHAENPKLPFVIQVVDSITNDDGFGTTSSFTYTYKDGFYYYTNLLDRKFAGFNSIVRKDADGNTVTTWYHQGNSTDISLGEYDDHFSKIGKAFRVETADSAGKIFSTTINKWDKTALANLGKGSWFVKLASSLRLDFGANASHQDRAESYTYDDTNGNKISMTEWGEVNGNNDGTFSDTGSDKRITTISYTTNVLDHLNGLPILEFVTDQAETKISETKSHYDIQPFGLVNKGNLTRQERWKTGLQYIDIEREYNNFGFLTKELDPLNNSTIYTPDSYNLYPITVTNALNQSTQIEYDYSSGKPIQETSPNEKITKTVYDAFDRPLEDQQSSLNSATTLEIKTTYSYVSETIGERTKQSDFLSENLSKDVYSYTDGFDRIIQTRTETETENSFAVTDIVYDNREYIQKESLPYLSSGTLRTNATTDSALFSTFSYDALGRTINVATSVGTTNSFFDKWETTVTDPSGKSKIFIKDAYDRLTTVIEQNGTDDYTTNYEYNLQNNLIKLTDALGNIRSFTYDSLSRRLTAQDLHNPTDTTFGIWTYTYDDAGNIVTSLSPNGVTVTYGYDALNRQTSENDIVYSYDFCVNGIGKLCKAAVNGGTTTEYTYDTRGNKASEKITINGTISTTGYTYDRQDNVLLTTNPDGTQVRNTYNTFGKLETIEKKSSLDSNFIFVVSNIDYGQHGQAVSQTNANGTTTTYTYDANARYRLIKKVTTGFKTEIGATKNTTTTTVSFYPTSGDGRIYKSNSSWDTAHDSTFGSSSYYSSTNLIVGTSKSGSSYYINRSFIPFDTSSLPDDATITDTKLKVYVYSKKNDDNDGDDFATVVQTSQPSLTSLSTADFDLAGDINNPTEGIDTSERKDITNVSINAYLTFNLNSTGRDWISKTSVTKLGLREGHDVIDSPFVSSSTAYSKYNYLYLRSSEYSGVSYDPYLEVTYTQATNTSEPVVTTLQELIYTYDNVGNITKIVDASETQTAKTSEYVYDDLYRLTSATTSGATNDDNTIITYAYNAIGNIIYRSDFGTYSYNGTDYANPHAVTSVVKTDGSTVVYSYDKNGNLISDSSTGSEPSVAYTWDYKNRLTSSAENTASNSPTVATTATVKFYPTTGDGWIYKNSASWDTAHDATSGGYTSSTGTYGQVGTYKSTSSYFIARSFLPFDTSSIPDDATVTSAALNVYVYLKTNQDNDGDDFVSVVQASQPNTSTLSTADYYLAGSVNSPTEGIDTNERKDITNVTTYSYLSFTLNTTGLGWISKIDATKLALREGHDVIDSAFTSSSTTATTYNRLLYRSSEYSGVSYDPYLEVTYTQASTDTTTSTSNIVTYSYDHDIRRVVKSSESGTTYYPTTDYSVKDGVSTVYVTGPSGLTASVENNPSTGSGSTTNTILTDHLGSTSVVTDDSGIMVELLDYNPYGSKRISWSSTSSDSEAD